MNYRQLGKTEIKVSEISLGCWTMGGLNWVNGQANGWANVDEEEITKGIKLAVDQGVNHFDNADVYGNGKAERMLARVLNKLGLNSNDFIIATKVGHFPGTAAHAYEPAHIRHQCEQSLINLRRDYIDLYYFHHGNFGENAEYLHNAAETMDALVREGKVRVKGQSAYRYEDFEKAVPVVKPEVLQARAHVLADEFIRVGGPLDRLMEREKISFVAFSPLAQGLLLDKFDPEHPPQFEPGDHRQNKSTFQRDYLFGMKQKMERVKQRFGSETETLSALAQRYILHHPRVACVIPGFRNASQVTCNLAAAHFSMTEQQVQDYRKMLNESGID